MAASNNTTAKTWDGPARGPIAQGRPHIVKFGKVDGENRGPKPIDPPLEKQDPLFWLRDDDRKDADVIGHLKREREFLDFKTENIKDHAEAIYKEHVRRLNETDVTAPRRYGPYEYYERTIQGLSYRIHCRRPRGSGRFAHADVPIERGSQAGELELLDVNKVAEGHAQCGVSSVDVSPTHGLLAFTVDFTGNEVYELHIRRLGDADKKKADDDVVVETLLELPLDGSFEWGLDDTTIYYTTRDDALRSFRIYRHVVGTPASEDELIVEEADEVWSIGCGKTLEGNHLVIGAGSSESSEGWILDLKQVAENDKGAKKPLKDLLRLIRKREFGVRYSVEGIAGTHVYISTNKDGCINEKVIHTTLEKLDDWSEVVVAHNPEVKIDSVNVFKSCMTVEGRENGLTQVWTVAPNAKGYFDSSCALKRVVPPEPIYDIGVGSMQEFDLPTIRIGYSSLTTPLQTWELEPATHEHTVIKTKIVNDYDPSKYTAERLQATGADGAKIDISLVRRSDLDMSKPHPTLLYGYGSYGICIDPDFNQTSLAYLERGVIYCIAHIRGGGENGRHWYEKQGKYLTKRNTFQDFVSCAEHLVDAGITTPAQLAIEGRSAGGLLMGAVVNMRPDLFKAVIAGVPFVDVMTTMCDPSIPLTTGEWEEWGNPNEFKYFHYMMSYSPMDNVRALPYPNMLIVAGLHDPRVAYWEPAKWATKLRENSTAPENDVLLKMDMEVGHFSASDRYKHLKEKAFEQAYVLSKIAPDTLKA